jgi:hypothetical protein
MISIKKAAAMIPASAWIITFSIASGPTTSPKAP